MSGLFGSSKTKATSSNPAIGALTVQQSSYSTPIPLCFGTNRMTGNIIWYDDFKAVQVSTGSASGGKGGGGSRGSSSYEWDYYASFAIGICEGPISSIGRIWDDKTITNLSTLGGSLMNGALGQSPWGYLSTYHPDKALSYNKMAYIGLPNFSLGTSTSTPNLAMEVFATPDASTPSKQDAWPSDIITSYLSAAAWPTTYLSTLGGSDFDKYTKAMGFAISPFFTEQSTAADQLKSIMDTLNSEFVWTNGVLKIIPYGDSEVEGNGAIYTPNMTPVYDLSNDDFIVDGDEDPITVEKTNLADCYNQEPIEFKNVNNSYNVETYTAEDSGHIDTYGIRTASTISAHHVTDPATAQLIASIVLWRQLYVTPTKYTFKLGWKHVLLEPMDYVTLTQTALDFDHVLVRVTDIEEDEDGMLTVSCEPVPGNTAQPAIYSTQTTERYAPNYAAESGSVNPPVVFEPTLELLQSTSLEIWLALSANNPNWGGCNIYISTDDKTYTYMDTWKRKARQGVLTAQLPSVTVSPDTTNTLAIDLSESLGILNGAPVPADAANYNTLSYVDGELLAYGSSTLTGANKYDLSYLVRGAYGTGITFHNLNSNFVRLDSSIYKYVFDQTRIGSKIYFKFQSFNIYGAAVEDLANIPSYSYTITGSALSEALGNPTDLCVSYSDEIAYLNWTGVTDIRSPIWYEVRKGEQWQTAQIVTTTKETSTNVYGSDTYWVSALYYTPLGASVYSGSPMSISVTTPSLQANIIKTTTEAPSWAGSFSGGAEKVGSTITLAVGSLSGSYTAPAANRIALSEPMRAKVIINWKTDATTSDITSITDITAVTDITGIVPAGLVETIPQIRLSQDGGLTWSDWQNWVPGYYLFDLLDYRLLLTSKLATATPIVSAFNVEVDVPSLTQSGTDTSSTSGLKTVTFDTKFNEIPVVTITNDAMVSGDLLVKGTVTKDGFEYAFQNTGAYVARAVSWTATSY